MSVLLLSLSLVLVFGLHACRRRNAKLSLASTSCGSHLSKPFELANYHNHALQGGVYTGRLHIASPPCRWVHTSSKSTPPLPSVSISRNKSFFQQRALHLDANVLQQRLPSAAETAAGSGTNSVRQSLSSLRYLPEGFKPESATQTITGMQRRTNQEHLNRHAGNHEGLAFAKQKHNAFMPWCSPLCVTFTSRRCCSCGCRLRQHLEHLSGLYLPDLSSLFLICLCCNTSTQA